MLSWKELLDKVQENSSDVGGGVVVERGNEPDDVSLSVIPHSGLVCTRNCGCIWIFQEQHCSGGIFK